MVENVQHAGSEVSASQPVALPSCGNNVRAANSAGTPSGRFPCLHVLSGTLAAQPQCLEWKWFDMRTPPSLTLSCSS